MLVKNALLGEIEVKDDEIIDFPQGIPGFESEKRFALLPVPGTEFFVLLQAVGEGGPCFTLADPEPFFPDYRPEVEEEHFNLIEAGPEDEVVAYVILTVPEDFTQTTANLMSPILINRSKKKGLQAVPSRSRYATRHRLFPEPPPAKKAAGGR